MLAKRCCLSPGIIWLFLIIEIGIWPQQSDAAAVDGFDSRWRTARNCGPNALYALLKLNGLDVNLQQILKLAPPDSDGVSIADLCTASSALGFPTTVVRVAPNVISGVNMPAIAHLSGSRHGHFVLILSATSEDVIVADVVACTIKRETITTFRRKSSGYLLIKKQPYIGSSSFWTVLAGLALMLVAVGSCRKQLARFFRSPVDA